MDPSEAERSARVHAALAYRFGPSSTKRPDQAEALGWKRSNTKALNRLLHGDETTYREKLERLAEVTGVPPQFFSNGFAMLDDAELSDQVSDLRRSVRDLIPKVAQHERELKALRGRDRGTGSTAGGAR